MEIKTGRLLMKRTIEAAFLDHPSSVGESYGEHFMFASRFGLKLIGAGLAALVHGLLPFAFESTASRTVKELYPRVANRGNANNA
jgi:hypothetical protein